MRRLDQKHFFSSVSITSVFFKGLSLADLIVKFLLLNNMLSSSDFHSLFSKQILLTFFIRRLNLKILNSSLLLFKVSLPSSHDFFNLFPFSLLFHFLLHQLLFFLLVFHFSVNSNLLLYSLLSKHFNSSFG